MKTKICTKCKIRKLLSDFYKDKQKKDGLSSHCKSCDKIQSSNYVINNSEKVSQYKKNWRIKNKQKLLNQRIEKHKKYPWKRVLQHIKQRCNNPNNSHYKYYGGRGIECRITEKEIKELYIRDKANQMKQPSIDRINNDGHYEYNNCRFIEQSLNSKKSNLDNPKGKSILQFTKYNKFIKKWNSIKDASITLSINAGNICESAKKSRKTAGGYIWRYK